MNLKPYRRSTQLSRTDACLRTVNDGLQQAGRWAAMGMANTVMAVPNAVNTIRNDPANVYWVHIRSNAQVRHQLLQQRDDHEPAEGTLIATGDVLDALDSMNLLDHLRPAGLTPFDNSLDTYYTIKYRPDVVEPTYQRTVLVCEEGRKLLALYYARKYNAQIHFVVDPATHNAVVQGWIHVHIEDLIRPLRQQPGDARHAFYLGGTHTVPVLYLREGGKEIVLVADSKGGKKDCSKLLWRALQPLGIEVLKIDEARQRDLISCYVDAMKLEVLATGRHRDEQRGVWGEYLVPDLLAQLLASARNSRHTAGMRSAKLPPEFLRLAQITRFVQAHRPEHEDPVLRDDPKGRTLGAFLDAYTARFTETGHKGEHEKRAKADYLRSKGEKYEMLIEIEYYNQHLKSMLGTAIWTPAVQKEFVRRLKDPDHDSDGLIWHVPGEADDDRN